MGKLYYLSFLNSVFVLDFRLSEEVKATITKAKEDFRAKTESLAMNAAREEAFGSNLLKTHKFGADAFLQLAIQVRPASRN